MQLSSIKSISIVKRVENRLDEFDDIVELLTDYRCNDSQEMHDIIFFIADACMGNNHLWEDMGLPNRAALTELMQNSFPTLAAKNTDNMKWKRFFYKQLCERAEVFICKSPSCGVCTDYSHCFESEDASTKHQQFDHLAAGL